VENGKLIVVDRSEIDLIRGEFDFQYSGEVGDDSMQALGRMLGAQSIISGSLTDMGGFYRIMMRVLNVQNASVEVQYRTNIVNDHVVVALLTGRRAAGTATIGGQTTQIVQAQPTVQTPAPVVTMPPITGIMVPGESLTEKLAWLQRSADSHNTYILEVTADEIIVPHTLSYQSGINITIVLRGDSQNRTIRLRSHGTMFAIRQNVTFILDNNITLLGHNGNNASLVSVAGGNFRMRNGSTITGNSTSGVTVSSGTFEMLGGIITDNSATNGGGVNIRGGRFTMSDGLIAGNTANQGGGVYGHMGQGNFTMNGGSITNNVAHNRGGGVFLHWTWFTKNGGTITGYNSDPINGNVVKDSAGNILARRGHAIHSNFPNGGDRQRNNTVGPRDNLARDSSRATGTWDN
jgi:hypothetical protein